jgi:hypothetical protein
MSVLFRKINSFAKDFLLASRIGLLLRPLSGALRFTSNFSRLAAWIHKYGRDLPFDDFYKPLRVYGDRTKLYDFAVARYGLQESRIHYFEFGVASASSFRWWLDKNKNAESSFHGFDTFEGLPEAWGTYSKGAMSFNLPDISDPRARFYKGLFQETLGPFLKSYEEDSAAIRVIHLDADLYSSTLFALTMLAPYLRPGDLLLFDEFNVPNHEFAAWEAFIKSYYFEYEVVGAINNYYQTCFRLTKTMNVGHGS